MIQWKYFALMMRLHVTKFTIKRILLIHIIWEEIYYTLNQK